MSLALTDDQLDKLRDRFDSQLFAEAYELMEEWTSASEDSDVQLVHTWLLGAADINRGLGPYAALVRIYNQRQGQLRDRVVNLTDNQEASDHMATLILNDTLNNSAVPDFKKIVDFDAEGGKYLYSGYPDVSDTARLVGANWTGTFLISPFGQDETGRLISTGESATEMDSVDDLKNILFASAIRVRVNLL